MRLKILSIALCLVVIAASLMLAGNQTGGEKKGECRGCHQNVAVATPHTAIACVSCHPGDPHRKSNPASVARNADGCAPCHRGYERFFQHSMVTRDKEKRFVAETIGKIDAGFFNNQCGSCHISSCLDCHGGKGHTIRKPVDADCAVCHKGYYIGGEYAGLAPREDNLRYQRGIKQGDDYALKMLPDVHATKGIPCSSCHSMGSLVAGKRSSKNCTDCHTPSMKVLEHRIGRHLQKLECYACHSAWASQEYGTFFVRLTDSPSLEDYPLATVKGGYVKSAYLKKQDTPSLGLNERRMLSPIRPEFILYFSDIKNDKPVGEENRLLAANWKAFFPHTISRGTTMCEGCHDSPRRFILEKSGDNFYDLKKDGMKQNSFWDRTGQKVSNGDFMPEGRVRALSGKSLEYKRGNVEKWNDFVRHVEGSSQD